MRTLIQPASVAKLILIVVVALTACGHGPRWTESLELIERPPRAKARAAVRLLATRPFKVSQTDRFSLPPGNRYEGAAKQWHLTAGSTELAEEIKFLAVLVPYREGEPEPGLEILQEGDSAGFQIGNTTIAAWWGEGPDGPIKVKGISGQGRLIVETGEGSARQTATDE